MSYNKTAVSWLLIYGFGLLMGFILGTLVQKHFGCGAIIEQCNDRLKEGFQPFFINITG